MITISQKQAEQLKKQLDEQMKNYNVHRATIKNDLKNAPMTIDLNIFDEVDENVKRNLDFYNEKLKEVENGFNSHI